jgi:hypothetical protein
MMLVKKSKSVLAVSDSPVMRPKMFLVNRKRFVEALLCLVEHQCFVLLSGSFLV